MTMLQRQNNEKGANEQANERARTHTPSIYLRYKPIYMCHAPN